ncbi:hypothetical protein CDCA_CDCA08G2445 [Cyanidium caldarium]|uniref:RING-type domain-containing protein n=1 Tax=Cyanidium caldarium TaxID=2771 RepID=A0AAV9IVS7_CYACA|nr:hypothetical protein CDCA_CDCA08G2445 [Cyanidium caldarium]
MLIAVRRQVIPAMFHLAIQSALKGVLPDAAGSISQWTLQTLLLFTADDAPHASLEADAFATGAWLQRTAVALTCYLRDRDAASLQVLLDQAVLPAKQGCGTATRCPTVTGPASRSLAVLGSCGDHADTCWEHQVDVCVASMLSICAALLQAAHLPETHRQELLARLARHACSAPSSPSHVRAAATVVSLARDRFIASLIRSIGRQGAVAVAAVRLQWMQTALPLGVVERHASLLVQTLCQYIKPLSLLRRDDALVLLADALESATFRDALTPPDIEAFLLVAVCALLQPDQADHRGHPLWQAAPGRILEAIAPRVLSSAYRTLLLTFVVRHRCAAAVPTVLTGGGRTAAADMVRVAVAYLRAASATGTAPAKNAMVDPPWPTTPESTHTRAVLSTMTRAAHQFLDTWAPSSSATDSPAPTRATTPAIERAHSLMAWTLSALCTVDVGNTLDVRFPADETWMTLVPSAVIGDTLSRVRVNTQQVLGAAVRQSDEAAQQHQHTIRALHHQIHALQQRLAQLERDHRNLEQATACVVCFEPLREPMALSPCGHVLCRACLQALLRGDATPACPTCRSAIAPDRVLPLHWL